MHNLKDLMNMKAIKLLVFIFFLPVTIFAQNCADYLTVQPIRPGYDYNALSKSGTVKTGKKYKFVFNLNKGKVYRFTFHSSSGLNNGAEFTITDQSTGQAILFLPRQVPEPVLEDLQYDDYGNVIEKTTETKEVKQYVSAPGSLFKNVLKAEYVNDKLSYPYFEFKPVNSLNLEVVVDVLPLDDGSIKQGCLGILVQDKDTDDEFSSL